MHVGKKALKPISFSVLLTNMEHMLECSGSRIPQSIEPHVVYSVSKSNCYLNNSRRRRGSSHIDPSKRIPVPQYSKDKKVGDAILFILDALWKEAIHSTTLPFVKAATEWIEVELLSPFPEVPLLFSVVGSSNALDISKAFRLLENELMQCLGKSADIISLSRNSACTSVIELLDDILFQLNKQKSKGVFRSESQKTSSNTQSRKNLIGGLNSQKTGSVISNFIHRVEQNKKSLVIVVEDSEKISKDIITVLINVCYELRTLNSTGRISVALIFGLSISTVQAVQMNWPSDTLLKTISTGAQLFNVKNVVQSFLNALITDTRLASIGDIPRIFLSALLDDVSQSSHSVDFVRRHVELYVCIALSLNPFPFFFVPITIVFDSLSPKASDYPGIALRITSSFPRNLEEYDVLSPSCLLQPFQKLYRTLLQANGSGEAKNPAIEEEWVSLLIERFSAFWKQRILFSIVIALDSKCNNPQPLVHKLPVHTRELYKISGQVGAWFKKLLTNALQTSPQLDVLEVFWKTLTKNDSHFLLLEIQKLERVISNNFSTKRERSKVTEKKSSSKIDCLNLHTSLQKLEIAASYCCNTTIKHDSDKTPRNISSQEIEHLLWDIIEQIILGFTQSPGPAFEERFLLPLVVKTEAWRLTTAMLNPIPTESVSATLKTIECVEETSDIPIKTIGDQKLLHSDRMLQNFARVNDVFIKDFQLFHFLLQCYPIKLTEWFRIFCEYAVGTLNIPFQQSLKPPENLGLQKPSKLEIKTSCKSTKSAHSTGCFCWSCLHVRFLLGIQSLVLLGYITEPKMTKTTAAAAVNVNKYTEQEATENDTTNVEVKRKQKKSTNQNPKQFENLAFTKLLSNMSCRVLNFSELSHVVS